MKLPLLNAEYLNGNCHCSTLAKEKLPYPHYFSEQPHFLSRVHLADIQQFIAAYETALTQPEVRQQFLAAVAVAERGIFNSYDFHIGLAGPSLIEINTNAAGAVLGLFATKDLKSCCDGIPAFRPIKPVQFDAHRIVAMFREEYATRFTGRDLSTVAIVDETPEKQFFFPEFELTRALLVAHGIHAVIAAPEQITIRGEEVFAAETRVDFIYNRLTDFTFEKPASAALRAAYDRGLVTISPNPALHALYARKSNLAAFWSPAFNAIEAIDLLRTRIPETRLLSEQNRDELWTDRKGWFFKPVEGFGGKAVYRGDKLTKRVWEEMRSGGYIAQRYIPPATRALKADLSLKYDLRVYTYGGEILGMLARYYQGQTTNLRTEHGGLASVMLAA